MRTSALHSMVACPACDRRIGSMVGEELRLRGAPSVIFLCALRNRFHTRARSHRTRIRPGGDNGNEGIDASPPDRRRGRGRGIGSAADSRGSRGGGSRRHAERRCGRGGGRPGRAHRRPPHRAGRSLGDRARGAGSRGRPRADRVARTTRRLRGARRHVPGADAGSHQGAVGRGRRRDSTARTTPATTCSGRTAAGSSIRTTRRSARRRPTPSWPATSRSRSRSWTRCPSRFPSTRPGPLRTPRNGIGRHSTAGSEATPAAATSSWP